MGADELEEVLRKYQNDPSNTRFWRRNKKRFRKVFESVRLILQDKLNTDVNMSYEADESLISVKFSFEGCSSADFHSFTRTSHLAYIIRYNQDSSFINDTVNSYLSLIEDNRDKN